MHRFTFDGRYAYISPEMDGYVGNIVMILDLADPAQPRRGRALVDAGAVDGRRRDADVDRAAQHRCHHPIRLGNRLYVSYWHGGFVILDIEDMAKPKLRLGARLEPAVPAPDPHRAADPVPDSTAAASCSSPTRTCCRSSQPRRRRRSCGWSTSPTRRGRCRSRSFQVEGIDGTPQPEFTGCHQPSEEMRGTEIPVAWFAHGLRIVDIANPHAPREVAHFMPRRPAGRRRACAATTSATTTAA